MGGGGGGGKEPNLVVYEYVCYPDSLLFCLFVFFRFCLQGGASLLKNNFGSQLFQLLLLGSKCSMIVKLTFFRLACMLNTFYTLKFCHVFYFFTFLHFVHILNTFYVFVFGFLFLQILKVFENDMKVIYSFKMMNFFL